MLRLTFNPGDTFMLSGNPRPWEGIVAEDAEGILDAWHDLPTWNGLNDWGFRERLIEYSGADVELPEMDDEILFSVVEALGPSILLEDIPSERQADGDSA